MVSIYAAIVIILTVWVMTRLILVIHEFGHAVPALLFTEGEVKVFIGSYGDPNDSFAKKNPPSAVAQLSYLAFHKHRNSRVDRKRRLLENSGTR